MALTDVSIRKAKGRKKQYKLADGAGLYLLVTPDSRKYWRLKYRHSKREKVLALGVYPDVSLIEARQGRDDAKRLLKQGEDPSLVRKQQRLTTELNAANTFERVARKWVDKQSNKWQPRHAERVQHSMEKDLFPYLGNRPLVEITAPEMLAVLRRVEKRGALETAQRLAQRSSAVFRYGIASGLCDRNPAADLVGALKTPKRSNRAAVKPSELPELLQKIAAYEGQLETRIGLQMLTLTFVRPGELRGAEWTEFDMDAMEWRLPAERMKMAEQHIVPLSHQVIGLLDELRPLTGHRQFLFPNHAKPRQCMSENTLLYALYRLGYHSRQTAHGFRSIASTILNEQGWRSDVIERQLAHAERDNVRAAYNHAQYLSERRQMMQAWADYLDALQNGEEIVSIRSA